MIGNRFSNITINTSYSRYYTYHVHTTINNNEIKKLKKKNVEIIIFADLGMYSYLVWGVAISRLDNSYKLIC